MKQTKRYKNSCYCLSINWQAQKNKTKLNTCFSYIAMRLVSVIDKWHPFFSSDNSTEKLHHTLFIQFSKTVLCFQILSVSKLWEWQKCLYPRPNLLTNGAQALGGNKWDFCSYSENDYFLKQQNRTFYSVPNLLAQDKPVSL